MTGAGISDVTSYDFCGHVQFLFRSVDVNDKALMVRRAIELQAFQVSLFYPQIYRLTASGKRRSPLVDMIALARKHAALELYRRYTARSGGIKGQSLNSIQKTLSINFERIEVLLEILRNDLHLEGDRLGDGENDVSLYEYSDELERQLPISNAVAALISAYRSNGGELSDTGERPVGLKKMIDALCDSQTVKKSEKTLDNYFKALEPTSIFLYLLWFQDCRAILRPTYPSNPKFAQIIMQRASSSHSVDELRAVCLLHNTVALELNTKYGFGFRIIENVPKPEANTDYDALADDTRPSPNLTRFITGTLRNAEL